MALPKPRLRSPRPPSPPLARVRRRTVPEVAGGVRLLAIHDGGGGGYASGVRGIRSAERPQSPHQARGFGAECAGEGMRFVEHEVVQPCIGEQFHVLLAREQQFQLLDVGEQDARLTARRPHRFPRAQLFRGIDRLAGGVASRAFHAGAVVRPGGTRRQPNAGHLRLPFRRLPDVQPERNAGAGKQPAQAHELILRQRVHRIDDHGADAGHRSFVPQPQTLADDGIEEALRLAGAGAGGDERGSPRRDGADGLFLVAVEGGEALRNALAEVGVQQALGHQRFHRGAFAEGAGKADVGPFEQGRAAGLVQREQFAHLGVEMGIGEGVGGELVAQEALDDALGVGDGVQGHGRLNRSSAEPCGVDKLVVTGGRLAHRAGDEVGSLQECIASVVVNGGNRDRQGRLLLRQALVRRHQRGKAPSLRPSEKFAVSQCAPIVEHRAFHSRTTQRLRQDGT